MAKIIPKTYTMRSKRIHFRILQQNDIPFIFEALHSEGFMDGMTVDAPETIEMLTDSLSTDYDNWQLGNSYTFSAMHTRPKDSEEFIGRVGIRKSEQADVWLINYYVHPEHQHEGYATELANQILRFGFEELKADTIEAFHAVPNQSSKRVLEKIGMKFVAQIERSFQKHGQWIDDNRFQVSCEDWNKQQEFGFKTDT